MQGSNLTWLPWPEAFPRRVFCAHQSTCPGGKPGPWEVFHGGGFHGGVWRRDSVPAVTSWPEITFKNLQCICSRTALPFPIPSWMFHTLIQMTSMPFTFQSAVGQSPQQDTIKLASTVCRTYCREAVKEISNFSLSTDTHNHCAPETQRTETYQKMNEK